MSQSTEHQHGAHTDAEPLLDGEQGSFLARIRRNLPTFSLRRWRRSQPPESSTDHSDEHDLEAGRPESSDASDAAGSSRDNEGATASSADAAERATSSHRMAERGASGESPSAMQGLLGGLLRLGSAALPTRGSNSNLSLNPTCLICLEPLAPEDFENGEAIVLECQCRGDLAMRHRTCAEKWAQVKGNRICDICKTVVKNLPEVTPRVPDTASTQGGTNAFDDADALRNAQLFAEQVPGGADVIFDCIRVTWVAMIICILFFEMNLANALWTGLIVGLAYTLFVRAMYRHQLAAMMREQQRNAAESPVHQHVVHVV